MRHECATIPTPVSTKSFWHSEPNEFLLGHRTTSELPENADFVIVGTGITGTSVARYLVGDERTKGKSIVVLEAREACWGATGRNGGHCQPLLFDRAHDVGEFELKNVAAVRSYVEANNVACEWRDVTGCRTFWTDETMKKAEQEVDLLKTKAPHLASHVSIIKNKDDLKKHRVAPHCIGATLNEGAAKLWPYKLVTSILEKLVKQESVNLQTNTPVTRISSSDQMHSLHTFRGTISTKNLILATNGYTSALVSHFADLIVPVRAQMSALLPPKDSARLPNSYGMVAAKGQNARNDDYLVQRPYRGVPNPKGHLMFGGGRGAGGLPTVGVSDDNVLDEDTATYLRCSLLELLELDGETEAVKELEATAEWTGIMGYSRDNHPWVGRIPDTNIWLCAGYTGHGMPNGTLCGKAVVEMVLAELGGQEMGAFQEKMVQSGDLPGAYIITKERIEQARKYLPVSQQETFSIR